MRQIERGFLLLTSHLGNPERKVLSAAQLRTLAQRLRGREVPQENRALTEKDLLALGYGREQSGQIVNLLSEEALLEHYLRRGARSGCVPVTRVSGNYPLLLRRRLGLDSPGCLWCKGDLSLLDTPAVSLVGSRDLDGPNRAFAAAVGRHAAESGLTLVSGNARGADRTAQDACLASGGSVISIVADELTGKQVLPNLLYISEEDFDAPFSAQRALSRNRCIHAWGQMVYVAQAQLEKGGTWSGTAKNLHLGWSPVACFRDGSKAALALAQMGARLIDTGEIPDADRMIGNGAQLQL